MKLTYRIKWTFKDIDPSGLTLRVKESRSVSSQGFLFFYQCQWSYFSLTKKCPSIFSIREFIVFIQTVLTEPYDS